MGIDGINEFVQTHPNNEYLKKLLQKDLISLLNFETKTDDKGRLHIDYHAIAHFNNQAENERKDYLDTFIKDELFVFFIYLADIFYFDANGIINCIIEPLKNVADWTNSDGYLDIKIIISPDLKNAKIMIAIGDDGKGISHTMNDPDKKSNGRKNYQAGLDMFGVNINKYVQGCQNGACKLHISDHGKLFTLSMPNISKPAWKYFEDIKLDFQPRRMQYLLEVVLYPKE